MVAVVQLVEHQVVILDVAGSSPVSHPTGQRTFGPPSGRRTLRIYLLHQPLIGAVYSIDVIRSLPSSPSVVAGVPAVHLGGRGDGGDRSLASQQRRPGTLRSPVVRPRQCDDVSISAASATSPCGDSSSPRQVGSRHQTLALPVFHCSHGMFQSPRPSLPESVDPTVLVISTMSPRLELL